MHVLSFDTGIHTFPEFNSSKLLDISFFSCLRACKETLTGGFYQPFPSDAKQPGACFAFKNNPGITSLRSGPSGSYTGLFLIYISPTGKRLVSFLQKRCVKNALPS